MNAGVKTAGGGKGRASAGRRRSAARLAAVQALYEMDMAGAAADPILGAFLQDRWKVNGENGAAADLAEPDGELLADLVRGVAGRREELDGMIGPALSEKWTLERLEVVLRAILRAGTYELLVRGDIPPRVVINEYLEVAHAFFAGAETGLVNGVLDRLARTLRPREMEETKGGQTTQEP
jgi:N utilization substance protein B